MVSRSEKHYAVVKWQCSDVFARKYSLVDSDAFYSNDTRFKISAKTLRINQVYKVCYGLEENELNGYEEEKFDAKLIVVGKRDECESLLSDLKRLESEKDEDSKEYATEMLKIELKLQRMKYEQYKRVMRRMVMDKDAKIDKYKKTIDELEKKNHELSMCDEAKLLDLAHFILSKFAETEPQSEPSSDDDSGEKTPEKTPVENQRSNAEIKKEPIVVTPPPPPPSPKSVNSAGVTDAVKNEVFKLLKKKPLLESKNVFRKLLTITIPDVQYWAETEPTKLIKENKETLDACIAFVNELRPGFNNKGAFLAVSSKHHDSKKAVRLYKGTRGRSLILTNTRPKRTSNRNSY